MDTLSEKLLDGTWTDANQFENDITVAMESEDDSHNEKQSSVDRELACHASETNILRCDSESNMDKRAREIFLELERIKRVVRDGASVPLSTLKEDPQKAYEKNVCDDRIEVERHMRKHKVQKSGYDQTFHDIEFRQEACGCF